MTDPESTPTLFGSATCEIRLTRDLVALVDAEDYKWLSKYHWQSVTKSSGISYAQRAEYDADLGRWASNGMHREIMGLRRGDKRVVDHINDDGLDNRKCNLRVCTHLENIRNKRPSATKNGVPNSSRYKGVNYYSPTNRWCARIRVNRKLKHLGYFGDEVDAAKAYNAAARKYFGEFARLNVL